jgi:broad specificity phosphatase PhoE
LTLFVAADLLILVKHAKPDVDPDLPSAEWTLGVEGIEGSRRLAERLRPLGVERVVTSVEPKAAETGRIVADVLDVEFQTGHDLHEHRRPDPGYLARDEFEAKIRRLFAEPDRKVFGAESGEAAATRFGTALDALARVYKGTRLCVVAHGTVISLHLERRYGVDGWSTWKALDVPSFVVVDRRTKTVVDVVRSV